jgi:hypothetical protein
VLQESQSLTYDSPKNYESTQNERDKEVVQEEAVLPQSASYKDFVMNEN